MLGYIGTADALDEIQDRVNVCTKKEQFSKHWFVVCEATDNFVCSELMAEESKFVCSLNTVYCIVCILPVSGIIDALTM